MPNEKGDAYTFLWNERIELIINYL